MFDAAWIREQRRTMTGAAFVLFALGVLLGYLLARWFS